MTAENSYQLEVELLSETIFNSGEKARNLAQIKALSDRHGFVYFHAKTLKGQLKRQAFWLLDIYQSMDESKAREFLQSIAALLGISCWEVEHYPEPLKRSVSDGPGIMKLSHLELDEQIRNEFIAGQESEKDKEYFQLSPHDLLQAQTCLRTGIQLEQGTAKEKRLLTYQTVKEGLVFYSQLTFDTDPRPYLGDLQRIVRSFRRIGANIHRGRGEIQARLLIDGEEANWDKSINSR